MLRILLALALATSAIATLPSAEAGDRCILGDERCLLHVQTIVCVTEPCDNVTVCVGSGLVCAKA